MTFRNKASQGCESSYEVPIKVDDPLQGSPDVDGEIDRRHTVYRRESRDKRWNGLSAYWDGTKWKGSRQLLCLEIINRNFEQTMTKRLRGVHHSRRQKMTG